MKGKRIRQRGKVRLSEYFKIVNEGERVTIVKEPTFRAAYPKRLLGRTGIVSGTRGKFKLVKIDDGDKAKTFIIHPIHLKKLK